MPQVFGQNLQESKMAYWKVQTNTTYTDSAANMGLVGNALRDILSGTATSVSDLSSYSAAINTGACYKVGTDATSGIYSSSTMSSYLGGASSSWYYDFTITKYPYSKNQTSGYDPSTQINFRSKTDYGFRWSLKDSANTFKVPTTSSSHTWTSQTNISYASFSRHQQGITFHIIRNDTTLFMAVHNHTDTAAGQDGGVLCVADHEYDSSLDSYMHSQNTKWYPGSTMWSYVTNSLFEDNNTATGTSNVNWYGIFRHEYLDAAGTNTRTGQVNDASDWHFGGLNVNPHYYAQWYPHAYMGIDSTQIASGEIHQLIPMTYQGNNNYPPTTGYGDPRISRIMNVYRTTDNQTHGERFQHGSDYYRVFRFQKTGDDARGVAPRDACIAFPENNIAF